MDKIIKSFHLSKVRTSVSLFHAMFTAFMTQLSRIRVFIAKFYYAVDAF